MLLVLVEDLDTLLMARTCCFCVAPCICFMGVFRRACKWWLGANICIGRISCSKESFGSLILEVFLNFTFDSLCLMHQFYYGFVWEELYNSSYGLIQAIEESSIGCSSLSSMFALFMVMPISL
jgi:hypothetical protein